MLTPDSTTSTPERKCKRIVVCCDGTGNEDRERNSNVVKLNDVILKQAGRQVAYYHPRVGTMGAKNTLSTLGKAWTKGGGSIRIWVMGEHR